MKYNKINNLTGWFTGLIACIVYLKTMEPTASFWDCGEFLSCAAKLEVGHSPGAPFFMMMQRIFAIFAPNQESVALFINAMSAIVSALTIVFLFWTITHFSYKILVAKDSQPTDQQTLLIMGAGLIGGLAYTFSDTFWFSAVEAEVYATSSLFTAMTFWAVLRWERVADTKYADRWMVLIAYLIGISLGIHLLNLLCIPPIIMIWYYRRYNVTTKGAILAFLAGCGILGFIQFGVIQYIPKLASAFDIYFTNNFGLPFDFGSVTFIILLVAAMTAALLWAKRTKRYMLHTGILSLIFIVIGYSSYIVPVIRSRADVPIDMTNPDNAFSLNSYVSREQFGQQPLLFGPDYNTPVVSVENTGSIYTQVKKDGKDYYEKTGDKREPVYDPSRKRFFPRIWEGNDQHPAFYRGFLELNEGDEPTSADNMKFFMGYQMGWMWMRYFMWNYAGRQNDFEGQGEARNGNWISGIKPLDKARVGDIDVMPDGYHNNAARNQLYFLPLILGIMGMMFHFKHSKRDAWVVMWLFFFTGAAIGIFLNMPPLQPRERDYAYAGCTYAFAIWIGMGVLMVYEYVSKMAKGTAAVGGSIALCLVAVPVLMAKEEWDDHDRSRKTIARDIAYNALMSCPKNAILLTFGDNDTYPLWYLQEIEGVRRDVRVMINTLVGTEWFIDQLTHKVNDADAVPMVWSREDYMGNRREYMRVMKSPSLDQSQYYDLYDICKFMVGKGEKYQMPTSNGTLENYIPATNVFVQSLSKEELVKKGMLDAADTANVVNEMKFTLPESGLYKNDNAFLNMIAAIAKEGWNRPICLSGSFPGNDSYLGLTAYLRQQGVVYQLVPYHKKDVDPLKATTCMADVNKSLDLFTNKFRWGGAERNDVYFDEKNKVMLMAYRLYASRYADDLTAAGRKEDAIKLLDVVTKNITEHSYPYDLTGFYIGMSYYKAGAKDKGKAVAMKILRTAEADIAWLKTIDESRWGPMSRDIRNDLSFINSYVGAARAAGDEETAKMLDSRLQALFPQVQNLLRQQ